MLFTRNLKQIIENYKSTLSNQEFQSFNNHVGTLVVKYIGELSKYDVGTIRGRRIHELIEIEIKKQSYIPVSCTKGCAACCHLEVEITSDDADVLAEAVLTGAHIDREKLDRLARRTKNDMRWNNKALQDNRCVFFR